MVNRIVVWIGRRFAIIASLAALLLMFSTTADVLWRNYSGRSVPGLLDFSETLMVFVVFLGLAHAESTGTHVRMTLVSLRLPVRAANAGRALSHLAMSLLLLLMVHRTGTRALTSYRQGESRFGLMSWPLWPARWVIVVGLAALLLVTVTQFVRAARATVTGVPLEHLEGEEDGRIRQV